MIKKPFKDHILMYYSLIRQRKILTQTLPIEILDEQEYVYITKEEVCKNYLKFCIAVKLSLIHI